MARYVTVAAAQMGPVQKEHTRADVVERLLVMLRDARSMGAELVVYPELALTTFFPRWFVDDIREADHWYEREMPSAVVRPLFDEAKRLGVGFCLGYALLDGEGRELDMGTAFDAFTPLSHHASTAVSTQAQRNRFVLLGLMSAAGWDFYRNEWWHYQLFDARRLPLVSDKDLPRPMM